MKRKQTPAVVDSTSQDILDAVAKANTSKNQRTNMEPRNRLATNLAKRPLSIVGRMFRRRPR